jgi:glycogen debranching enzyme
MDTVLRAGKIVYSQATWVLALKNFSAFIFELDNKKAEAKRTSRAARKSIDAVDQKLWSQRKNCYVDLIQKENHGDCESGIITQDVLTFLLAVSEKKNSKNYENDENNMNDYGEESNCVTSNNGSNNSIPETHIHNKSSLHQRGIETLDAVRKKIWKAGWPLVTESQLSKTGPAILRPNEYHNYTCWPWMTATEMLARIRFGRLEKQDLLFLSELISKDNGYAFYEWIDSSTETGYGAFPFRTGISCIRLALREIIKGYKNCLG